MPNGRDVVIRLRGDISDFQAKMVAAGKSIGATTDKMTNAEKESAKFRRGLSSVGDAAGKIGLVAAAGLGAAVATAAKFDKAMSSVRAATHETAENMGQLREAAIKAGADTAFSASEAAQGIENLAKAGVATKDILGGGLQGALDLAAAGTMEVADAAEAAAGAMAQFGLDGEKVPHIADLLAAAAGKAQGEVSDMVMALKQSGTVAAQTGLSLEETTAALAAMAEQSLLGSDAGTSFKTMLMRLLPQTKEAGDAMEAIGFSAFDAQGNLKSLTEIAGGLHDGLKDMTTEQRQATLATIFGQDAIRAATILYDNGAKGIEKWTEKVDDSGYAAETASIKLDNLSGDLEAFKGSLETALIGAGEGTQGQLRGLVQGATDAVNAFNGMPPAIQGLTSSMLGITAITGGGLWFGSKVITGIADTREAMKNLGDQSALTSRALGAVSTALKVGLILEGLNLIGDAIDATFNQRLDPTHLTRSIDALLQGRVQGELLQQYGKDLVGFADDVELASSNMNALSRGAMKIPLVGDFIAGDWLPNNAVDAIRNMEELDAKLAAMVDSGDAQRAAALFQLFSDAAKRGGQDINDVLPYFSEYQLAVDNLAGESRDFGVQQRVANRALSETEGPAGRAARGIEAVDRAADGATTQTELLDAALGDLEVTLSGRQKNRAYEQSLDDLAERFKERRELLQEIADARSQLSNPDTGAVGDAQADVAKAQRDLAAAKTASARESAREQLANARDRLSGAQAAIGESAEATQERIKDLEAQLADFKLTLNEGEQAGRDWNSALEDIALNAQEAAQDLDGMDRVKYLNNARQDFIDLATKITGSREKAKELADELGLLHRTEAKPKIEVDTKPAETDVRKFYRWLENLPPATVRLMVETMMGKNDIGEKGDPRFDRGFAEGGYTGNRPADAIAGVVHGREFVFDAQMTAMYRPLFEMMHRTRRVPGYREGGYVAAQTSTTNYYGGGVAIDYDRLALAISRVRPMYGDAHFYSEGDYERARIEHARTSSLDGVR